MAVPEGISIRLLLEKAGVIAQEAAPARGSGRALIAPVANLGIEEPLTKEKLCPVLTFATAANFDAATILVRRSCEVALGHSAAFHGKDPQRRCSLPVPCQLYRRCCERSLLAGAAGFATHSAPSFMIGRVSADLRSGEILGRASRPWTACVNSETQNPLRFQQSVSPFENGQGSFPGTTPKAAPATSCGSHETGGVDESSCGS